jgi:hypothetical protein
VSAASIETTRSEWEESSARLEAEPDRSRYLRLLDQVELVVAELRKRVGQTFTLAELAEAYEGADRWARGTLAEAEVPRDWPRTLSTVVGAAFHRYARGAADYVP